MIRSKKPPTHINSILTLSLLVVVNYYFLSVIYCATISPLRIIRFSFHFQRLMTTKEKPPRISRYRMVKLMNKTVVII